MVEIELKEEAYEDILIHVLQFGSKSLRKSQEVFGLIFGTRAGDKVSIAKIIPVKHGPDCEKAFSETDLVTISEIENDVLASGQGYELFGYYTSHPNMGFYLSQNEIKNLLYFIKEKSIEHAIALVADHSVMDKKGDFGIKAFHIKNPEKGMMADFEEITLNIEELKDLSIFKKFKTIIEKAQKHLPFVEEKGTQLSLDDNVWDDAFSFGEEQSEEEKLAQELAPINETLKSHISNFEESFIKTAIIAYRQYLNKITEFVVKTYNDPNTDIVNLRSAFDDGMGNVQKWFEDVFKKHADKIQAEYNRTNEMVEEFQKKILDSMNRMIAVLKKQNN